MSSEEKSYDKATEEFIGYSSVTSSEDLPDIINKAREAQNEWSKTSIKHRSRRIKRITKQLPEKADNLSTVISKDNGKTRVDALATEMFPAAIAANYYAKKAKKFLKDKYIIPSNITFINKISKIRRVPFGVIGIISPWNYPFTIPFSEVIMALLAGNAVILKTASETQMAGLELKKIIEEAGLPKNLFNYVNMKGNIAGNSFLENGVDKLFFTGSVPVGKHLMKKASETLTPISLELGGNDAMIVCPDVNLDRAAAGAVWAGFQNAGQSCGAVERIYVHKDVYEDLLAKLKTKTESLKVGYGCNFSTDIGVMTTEKQVQVVNSHIQDALENGAKIFAGSKNTGTDKIKNSITPTILINVNHKMKIMNEETFGPVIAIMKVDSIDEAIRYANSSRLGLTTSIWTKNQRRAKQIGKNIRAGVITINDHLISHAMPETPWGGFKESGIGRTHGEIGFLEMTEPQVVVNDIFPFMKKNLWWYPHGKLIYNGIKGLLELLYGRIFKTRIKGLWNFIRIFPRIFFK